MKKYIGFLITIIGICSACSVEQEQELIIVSKNKKKYVSKEQCVESKLDSPVLLNRLNRSINSLRSTVDALQEEDFDILNDYAEGEKNCFFKRSDKFALTQYHEKQVQLNHALELYNKKVQKMQQELHRLHVEMHQIQEENQS